MSKVKIEGIPNGGVGGTICHAYSYITQNSVDLSTIPHIFQCNDNVNFWLKTFQTSVGWALGPPHVFDKEHCALLNAPHSFENCETQPLASIGWVALSSMLVRSFVRLFVRLSRIGNISTPLISTIWCYRPYNPYIFCEDMILATCQCHILSYIYTFNLSFA